MKESKCFLPKQGFNAFFPQAITGLQAVGPQFTKRVVCLMSLWLHLLGRF